MEGDSPSPHLSTQLPTPVPAPRCFTLYGPPEVSAFVSPYLYTLPSVPHDAPPYPLPYALTGSANHRKPHKGKTENKAATYLSSGNPCVDFFFHVVPDTPPTTTVSLLSAAWNHDPLTALKLVCHLRSVRGTGKSDKEGFYTAASWLHARHPKTLALNARSLAEFGYLKDLLEILFRLVSGENVREEMRKAAAKRKAGHPSRRRYIPPRSSPRVTSRRRGSSSSVSVDDSVDETGSSPPPKKSTSRRRESSSASSESEVEGSPWPRKTTLDLLMDEEVKKIKAEGVKQWVQAEMAKLSIKPEDEFPCRRKKATKQKKEVKNNQKRKMARYEGAIKAVLRYSRDPAYRFLHNQIADLFADLLTSDLRHLRSNEMSEIGLAAKWCPSLDSSFDRGILICESIARRVFPVESNPSYAGMDPRHYVFHVRNCLRQEVLVPLRKALEIPEVYMSANNWSDLPYNRVPSVAMKNYAPLFEDHDCRRFKEHLEEAVAAGALLPHEILHAAYEGENDALAEAQWERMVRDMTTKGKLRNCLAVCDVSGSMCGLPLEVSIAMGMLLSELSEEPWKGYVIAFGEEPQLQKVEGETLKERMSSVRTMGSAGNGADLQKVFERILQVAVGAKLKEEHMIKWVFVFSSMEFEKASAEPWETDYVGIRKKFEEAGYGSVVPQVVFWNLRDSRSTPVKAVQEGVSLVSGFSKNMMRVFLENDGVYTPDSVMRDAISGDEYQKLVVFD